MPFHSTEQAGVIKMVKVSRRTCPKQLKWGTKAAEQGEFHAQFVLAHCYEKGDGVEKNMTQTVKWYRKAAENADKGQDDETLRKQFQELKKHIRK